MSTFLYFEFFTQNPESRGNKLGRSCPKQTWKNVEAPEACLRNHQDYSEDPSGWFLRHNSLNESCEDTLQLCGYLTSQLFSGLTTVRPSHNS